MLIHHIVKYVWNILKLLQGIAHQQYKRIGAEAWLRETVLPKPVGKVDFPLKDYPPGDHPKFVFATLPGYIYRNISIYIYNMCIYIYKYMLYI